MSTVRVEFMSREGLNIAYYLVLVYSYSAEWFPHDPHALGSGEQLYPVIPSTDDFILPNY
jgi:hypothetical protein